ncbi:MAG TPA: GNAT family N-acetyltransferase [Capsulimonadaceae bacterium]
MGAGVSDYNDIIAEEGLEQAACEAIYTHLASSLSWQIGDFAHLREGSLCRAHPPSATSGLVCSEHPLEKCPYLPYPPITDADRWASLLKNYSKKTRSHIGYYERRLKGIFEVENGLVESQDQLPDAMTALFELHRRRWNKRWLPGVLGSSQMQSFHRAVAKDFLTRGWLRLHYLILDGDYQAVLYCFAFGDRTCYYQGGFEPTMARHSLGSVLTATAIKQSINESKLEFDFLRGDEPYKERWTQGHSRMNIRRLVAKRGTPMLRWAQQAHILEHKIETRFKDFMHHAYTKDQPKKVSAAESEGESDH